MAEFNATVMVLKTPAVDDVLDRKTDVNDLPRVKRSPDQEYEIYVSYYLGNVVHASINNMHNLFNHLIVQIFAGKS